MRASRNLYADHRKLKIYSIAAGMSVLGFFMMQGLLSLILSNIGTVMELYNNNVVFVLALDSIYSVVCLGVPFLLAYFFEKNLSEYEILPLGKAENAEDMLLLIFAALGACIIGSYVSSYFSSFLQQLFDVKFTSQEIPLPNTSWGVVLYIVRSAMVPALIEEFAIRGVVMQPLRKYGDWFAMLMSSMVFALMHGNMIQIPFAFLAGLAISFAVIKTGSLWTGIIIHFLNNFVSVVQTLLYYNVSSESYTRISLASNVLIIAVGCLCAMLYYRKLVEKRKERYRDFYNPGTFTKREPVLHYDSYFPMVPCILKYVSTVPLMFAIGYMLYQTAQFIS